MNELEQLKTDIHKELCELWEAEERTNKTISSILDLISDMRKEMKSLRTDVDKLIENNGGSYGRRTA